MTVKEKIDYLVRNYTKMIDSDLFKAELEMLVLLSEREQMKKDRDATMKIITESL